MAVSMMTHNRGACTLASAAFVAAVSIFILAGACFSAVAAKEAPAVDPGTVSGSVQINLGNERSGMVDPQDSCSFPYPGDFGNVIGGNWLMGDETYFVYQDPQTSSCSPSTPFGITGLKLVLCYDDACTTNMMFEVYEAVGDSCPTPGAVIYSTAVGQLALSGGPLCPLLTVTFGDTVCVNDDFFISFTFPDSLDCLNLFTDTLPGPCLSYNFAGDTLLDLNEEGFPGQIWVQTVGLNQAQSGCSALQSLYTIPELYDDLATVDGEEVEVICSYTNPEDGKIVDFYGDYLKQELMPLNSVAFLSGPDPDSLYWNGGVMRITGTVSYASNPHPVYGPDSVHITLTATSYEYLVEGNLFPSVLDIVPSPEKSQGFDESDVPLDCDPCKFAILISGGGDAANNKQGFWEDLEALYEYKTDPAGGNYCPENVEVLYFEGDSEDTAAIPHDAVDPCTQANIEAAHEAIAQKIAECEQNGMDATVQKFVTNHGADDDGFVTLGDERVSPTELKNMQQTLIDSCCDYMYDEFTQCFGGDMVNGLKMLDDKDKTEIHANSAAGENNSAYGDADNGSAYLKEKIARLIAGDDYETAVRKAKDRYREYLDSLQAPADTLLQKICDVLDTLPVGHPDRPTWERLKQKAQDLVDKLQDPIDEGSPSFVSFPFTEYCQWEEVVMPTGGQIKLRFSGSGGCGNVTVYCQEGDGSWKKYRVWNWNLPGSFGYSAGNETRVFNGDPTSTGKYRIHNDNGAFTVRAESCPNQDLAETPSNIAEFAGFSVGGSDESSAEFGNIGGPVHIVSGTNQEGFDLETVPRNIGLCGGVGIFEAQYQVDQANEWWSNTYLWLNVLSVSQPGDLSVVINNAEIGPFTMPISSPGIYAFPVGQIQAPSTGSITFDASGGNAPCFEWDSWGLRTNAPTFPEIPCGDANGDAQVSITDAVYLINYIFGGGPAPVTPEAADANCDGTVSISDAVYIVNFIFGGGPAPCAECP